MFDRASAGASADLRRRLERVEDVALALGLGRRRRLLLPRPTQHRIAIAGLAPRHLAPHVHQGRRGGHRGEAERDGDERLDVALVLRLDVVPAEDELAARPRSRSDAA
jgi:hypothetical protein